MALVALFVLSSGVASAQVKAVPDNYFLEPGKTQFFQILLNDDPGTCSELLSDLNIELVASTLPSYATNGIEVILSTNQRIRVRTKNTARGQWEVKYKISCKNDPTLTSEASVFLNFAQRPDFIDAATCTTDRPPMVWDIENKFISKERIAFNAYVFAGDVDGDGQVEIIAANAWNGLIYTNAQASGVYIFDHQLNLKDSIVAENLIASQSLQALAIADIDPANNDGPELLLATTMPNGNVQLDATDVNQTQLRLYCYHYDQSAGSWYIKWKSSDRIFSPQHISSIPEVSSKAVSTTISIADIDGDGLVEILVGDRVFSGGDRDGNNGGQLLATMPMGGRGIIDYYSQPAILGYMTSFADIDGDGEQEIVAGNTTYKMKLNHETPALSKITKYQEMSGFPDGIASVADIDGDGILDVLVTSERDAGQSSTKVYAWQGGTATQIGNLITFKVGHSHRSRIFAGDIDGDGHADFALTTASRFDAYRYDKLSNTFKTMFTTKTSDTSGSTTMTMFDFDNNGKMELVYRDETRLRIINDQGKDIIAKLDPVTGDTLDIGIECYSATFSEHPIVVDVDGDGHAEIIVSGGTSGKDKVYAQIFGSVTPDTWSPARRVWHQHGYNPTQINDDLTVPQYPLSPTVTVARADGSAHQPYNGFLMQSGIFNIEGEFISKTHDLAFLNRNQGLAHDTGTDIMTVTGYLTNEGSVDFSGDILLGFYGYDGTAKTYHKIEEKVFSAQTVAIYEQKTLELTVANYSSVPTYDRLYLIVNMVENGTRAPKLYYKNQNECVSWNNLSSRFSYMSGQTVLCENETGILKLEPAGAYDCYWYTLDSGGNRVPYPTSTTNKGDSKQVTKTATGDRDQYIIVACTKNTLTPITVIPDTAFVYTPMDSLVWTGAVSKDWHNTYNWSCPSDPSVEQRFRYIPGGCTNVLIPSEDEKNNAITTFPDLSATETDYTAYFDSRCNNITFEHGSEVVFIDHLIYKKAFVNVDMLSNRWYAFSAPLMDFYSGDIYKDSPNPFTDKMEVNTRLFSQTDPEYGIYREGAWGPAFATPTHQLHVGQGMGVWLDDHEPNPSIRANVQFSYPKHDPGYYMYYWDTGAVQSGPYATARTHPHRFIFEENWNASTKEVKLKVEAKTVGKEIMIGNPYMAHLDFDKFYAANSDKIEPYYKVIDEAYSYPTYYKDNPSGSTGTPRITKDIAPMQAFIVTPKKAIDPAVNPLITKTSMMLSSTNNTLRSAMDAEGDAGGNYFKVSVSDVMKRSKTSIIVDKAANSDFTFDKNLDVMKTIKYGVKEYPVIYTIADGGTYTEIKSLASISEMSIPLGLCYQKTGLLALGFENIRAFTDNYLNVGQGYHLYLEDKLEDRIIEITESNSIYSFNKENNDVFTNDRFVLRISQSAMNIEEAEVDQSIVVTVKGNQLQVTDKNGESLEQVVVYSMHGVLACNARTADSAFSTVLNPGVYVVKVKGLITKVLSE